MTKKLVLGFALLVIGVNSVLVGCGGGDPGTIAPPTPEELKNDPATKEQGV